MQGRTVADDLRALARAALAPRVVLALLDRAEAEDALRVAEQAHSGGRPSDG